MKKYTVIFISPGPMYNPDCPFVQSKYIALSSCLRGYILTTADNDDNIKMGSFECRLMPRKRFLNVRFLLFCLVNAYKIKKKEKIDCIITYDPLKTGVIGYLLKKVLGAKLIVEVNGVYTSPIAWADELRGILPKVKRLFVPAIMRYVFRRSDGIKLLFAAQINDLGGTVRDDKVAIFPDWVPVSLFKDLGETKEVLFIGFPFIIKGVDVLIESFKLIASKFPDWKLKILGWYPDSDILDKAIGTHPQIFHHLPVPYSKVPQHIGKCGMLVLPSRTEAMGRVLLESAAAGKPRIGSDVDGIPTVITDGVDGFLVESENIAQLAERMSVLMENSDLRHKIGSAAKERVEKEFSEKKYVENFLSFIKLVISD